MPLDPVKIAVAVSSGLSAVCATCDKYWAARERGVPGDRCLSIDNCGSPLAGDDFHEYKGPLTDLRHFCFVCGNKSKYGIVSKGKTNIVGVCESHVDFVKKYRPISKEIIRPQLGIRTVTGEDPLKPKPEPKSLMKAIYDVEQHFADKAGVPNPLDPAENED